MFKKISLILLFVAVAVVGAGTSTHADQYFNGFEGDRKAAQFYNRGTNANFVRTNSSKQAYRGNRALKIISRNNQSGSAGLTRWMTANDHITIEGGEGINLNAQVRTRDVQRNARLAMVFYNGNKQIKVVSSQKLSGTNGWTKLSINTNAPNRATHARIELRLNGSGRAWFDNVRFKSDGKASTQLVQRPVAPAPVSPPPQPDPTPAPEPQPHPPVDNHHPAGGPAIKYTGVNQYNWRNATKDDYVATTFSDRFKPGENKGQQLFTVDCKTSHLGYNDPIIHPGHSGGSHYHEFFGATNVNAHTTTNDILSSRNKNTCDVGADHSAYWTPVAYDNGGIVRGLNNKFYYKVGNVAPGSIQPMPVGLRMVAGNAHATNPSENPHVYLFTTTGEKKVTEPKTQQTDHRRNSRMFTTSRGENGVRLRIVFPNCWDGKNLWLPGTAHMAYDQNGKCPSSHPVPLLTLIYNIGYSGANGGSDFHFSSGEWFTGHGDFINGWRHDTLTALTEACIKAGRYCSMTKSDHVDARSCQQRSSVRNNQIGCVEVRGGNQVTIHGRHY